MGIDLKTLTIKKAHDHLVKGDFSAMELAEEYLKSIEEKNSRLNVYLEVFEDVIEQAREADKKIKSGESHVLTGIPMAIKDNILITGKKCSSASKILEGFIAPYDATAISKLKKAGVVFLGRTNMDEFAMGVSTENSAYGVTRNPHDEGRVPGGSSGGSAAAVAAHMALASLGSDTGGSIRQPASFCGVVGMKPTYGAVSRYGLMALASSFDQIGPITKTPADARIIFDTISGEDPLDSTSFYHTKETPSHFRKRIGVPKDFISRDGIDTGVLQAINEAEEKFKSFGYEIVPVSLPNAKYAVAVYYIILPAEASSNLARYDGMKYGAKVEGEDLLGDYIRTRGQLFGSEPRRRIMLGTYVLSSGYYDAYYGKALKAREVINADFEAAFEEVDLILTPTSPAPAFKIGEKSADPLQMYLEDVFTCPVNIAGLPAVSIPAKTVKIDNHDLPIGIQLIAPKYGEREMFMVAEDFLNK